MNMPNANHIPPAHSGLVCTTLTALCQVTQTLGLALGPQGFVYTNMLVSVKRNARVGAQALLLSGRRRWSVYLCIHKR